MSQEDRSLPTNPEALLEEVESLTWALLDDQLDEADGTRLTQLLEAHEDARARYVECVQLHIDLQNHYAGEPTAAPGDKSKGATVLPNLMPGGMPGVESRPPVTD
jgi:hypothetical protein